MRISELILYRDFHHGDILDDVVRLYEECAGERTIGSEKACDTVLHSDMESLYPDILHKLIELSSSHGFEGNLWHTYLTYLLANHENAYSTACEIRGYVDGSINDIALHDFGIFKELFAIDFARFDAATSTDYAPIICDYKQVDEGKMFNKRIRDRICDLAKMLATAGGAAELKEMTTQFYQEFGVGKFGLHKAFRIDHDNENNVLIKPITNIKHVYLEDLVGYELAKQKLIDNTEAFIEGKPCNNCLLFGDAGTGKSSSIKGILNRYYEQGLRIIEVYKHQFVDLNEVIAQVKSRNYKFILYMDDLSFEDFEIEYKYLKAVIEGGLEKKPGNILIYATSNRRHIVRENYNDRAEIREDMHADDTVQEKLSLSSRFGVTIYFGSPSKKEFNNIVTTLAKRHNIVMDEAELLLEANKWELSHGGLSGRTAQNFINYILGGK